MLNQEEKINSTINKLKRDRIELLITKHKLEIKLLSIEDALLKNESKKNKKNTIFVDFNVGYNVDNIDECKHQIMNQILDIEESVIQNTNAIETCYKNLERIKHIH